MNNILIKFEVLIWVKLIKKMVIILRLITRRIYSISMYVYVYDHCTSLFSRSLFKILKVFNSVGRFKLRLDDFDLQ